jgi:hypothetical protein
MLSHQNRRKMGRWEKKEKFINGERQAVEAMRG